MPLNHFYAPIETEAQLCESWQASGLYHFDPQKSGPVYSIDTPPPTVSGNLHLGHVFSYSHADFIARFRRMRGDNVFYPMGYDDNGLPTERLVEKRLGITPLQVGRARFIEHCLQISETAERDYQQLWQRLGLSIDWRYTYRTIDERSRRISQLSFIDLYRKGLAYQRQAPAIWCPECRTALAQADLDDIERPSEYVHLRFDFASGEDQPAYSKDHLTIATTRPELLPACVAVFIHPEDARFHGLAGQQLIVPLFGQQVPILEDPAADPEKGSGAVMCCTFGDTLDVSWWHKHQLPLIEAISDDGRMTSATGEFSGMPVEEARQKIKTALKNLGYLLDRQPATQSIRVHERCDTPVEYIVIRQWFIRLLEFKETLLEAGTEVKWHPEHMGARYRAWVENLNWDWCISRQRTFGVPFPVWYCKDCGEVILADESQLPIDPLESKPAQRCQCGGCEFQPELDVMDTWATSSLSPQIVGHWPAGEPSVQDPKSATADGIYKQVFPFSLRPQAHEIIRTWAFYTIAKSMYHFNQLPWKEVLISGWGLAGEGMGKISKSRGGGPMSPMEMISRYSADAVRYWAASTTPGKDALINEEKIQMGSRLVTKLWNVARFCERFIQDYQPPIQSPSIREQMTAADLWIMASLQHVIRNITDLFESYDYASAKNEMEAFFWGDLADNYLEMCKQRLYDPSHPQREGARFAIYHVLLNTLKCFAPFLPYITEQIYLDLFAGAGEELASIHISAWPQPDPEFESQEALEIGDILKEIATTIRRYKSEHNLPLGKPLGRLQLAPADESQTLSRFSLRELEDQLRSALPDLASITRAGQIELVEKPDPSSIVLPSLTPFRVAIQP